MNIEVSGAWAKVTLSGDVDLSWKLAHEAELAALCQQPLHTVVLDIEDVSFMDSTALGYVAQLVRACKPQAGTVYVLWPSKLVAGLFNTVGLDRADGVLLITNDAQYGEHAGALVAPDPDPLPA